MSIHLILPFLRPIEPLLDDPEVSEIMVNAGGHVFVERHGRLAAVPEVTLSEPRLQTAVRNLARILGDEVSYDQPILDARLPDGSRVAAVVPPCSLGGTTLTIRKFQSRYFSVEELVRVGTLTADVARSLATALRLRENLLISGGTGAGKTTLLNALAACIPPEERVIVLEDTAELQLGHPNLVRFEARRAVGNTPAVSVRDLVKATLRHRPDRIIVGEVRGAEAFDLLQALNTGHAGSLSTIHANSSTQALRRLASCVLQSNVEMPYAAVRHTIADTIQWCVHMARVRDVRMVTEVARIVGYDPASDSYAFNRLSAAPVPHRPG